jgi:hypothetical protein
VQIKCAGLQDDPEMMAVLDEMRRETIQLEQLAAEVRTAVRAAGKGHPSPCAVPPHLPPTSQLWHAALTQLNNSRTLLAKLEPQEKEQGRKHWWCDGEYDDARGEEANDRGMESYQLKESAPKSLRLR